MSLEFRINMKPLVLRCPDCAFECFDWRMLFLHWRKANTDRKTHRPEARRFLPHWYPKDRDAKLSG